MTYLKASVYAIHSFIHSSVDIYHMPTVHQAVEVCQKTKQSSCGATNFWFSVEYKITNYV